MPSFNFVAVKKESKTKSKLSNNEIITRKVKGVIFINLNGDYYVKVGKEDYNITPESYSVKSKQIIYRRGYDLPTNLVYVRTVDNCIEQNPLYWTPFGVGSIVKGNAIINKNDNTKTFVIDKIETDYTDEIAHEARLFYREHYKEINDNIKKKWIDAVR